ncbi:CMRF35-like molecule 1 [Sceloporus undulatus]|uniref:CMRF35-like molecule 1 n=1 Tax=Sceloporus undulatus TaxID=8520 RepID=UPI001C4B7218|nr:CMRF35-like molecule 1 [Sceloporus undulatus]
MPLLALVGSLFLLPGYFCELTGPETVRAILGTSAHVHCTYDQKYEANVKYWCKKTNRDCPIVVQTSGSEKPVKVGRVSIRDSHALRQFTVTMETLTARDTGTYSCGVNVNRGPNLLALVNVTVTTGNSNSPELSEDFFSSLDSSSISYLIYVSFLVSIGLKMPILLCLVLAMGWIYRKKKWSSDQVTSETPS